MSCTIIYNNNQMPQEEFVRNYIPKQGEIIEYDGIEYKVYDSNQLGSQFLNQEALSEEPTFLQHEASQAADEIPFYNLSPIGKSTVELGIDPIFNIPLTTLLQEGFTKTGKTFDPSERSPFEPTKETDLSFQIDTVQASKASKEQIAAIKDAALKMGINITDLTEYAKGNPAVETKGVNGVADLIKKTIGIAEGMEEVALTEEVVHIATAMMEQVAPKLVTEMISKIDRFGIYKIVYDEYKNLKAYQLANGKPNIRMIKKEAVDKLIAEVYLNPNPDTAQYPELLEPLPKSLAKLWWEAILDVIRGMYRKSNIDVYKKAGEFMASGALDASITPTGKGVFYQKEEEATNAAVDKIFDSIRAHSVDTELKKEVLDAEGKVLKRRHYLYKGIEAVQSVTEKVKKEIGRKFKRTDAQKRFDIMKRDWGVKGHLLVETFLPTLIDKTTGFKRENPLEDNITSDLKPEIETKIKDFLKELVGSYPPGTRFLFEEMVVNTKVKGMMGGTVDLIIIEPTKDKNGNPDAKVDVFDWKFTSLSPHNKEDIPWYKQKEWVAQMGEYTRILYNYGLNRNQLRKARMIPFIVNYEYAVPNDNNSELVPKTLEIGKLNSLEETNLYLLPVPLLSESTGNPAIDKLVNSLRAQHEKLYKQYVDPEEKAVKDHKLNEMSIAIRNLQMKLNFDPLIKVAKAFLESASKDIKEYEKIDFNTITEAELEKISKNLLSFVTGSLKYQTLDTTYLSNYSKESLTPEQKITFDVLENISSSARRMVTKINEIQAQIVVSYAVRENVDLDTSMDDVTGVITINPEIPMASMDKNFSTPSKVNATLIRLAAKYNMVATKIANQRYMDAMSDFGKLVVPLEKIAKSRGKKAFDMIGKITPSKLELIKKFDSEFWAKIKEARENSDKAFLMSNMDMDKFSSLAEKALNKKIAYLEEVFWSADPEENERTKMYKILEAKDQIDITRKTFDGYKTYAFGEILNQVLLEEGNLSKEYSEMTKTPEALAVWNLFTDLNVRLKANGYLSKSHSTSFFPVVEATTIQKLGNGKNIFNQLATSIRDMYIADIDERQNLSKIDPETGDVKREIPKYFTQSNKDVSQLSTDLAKIGSLWLKATLDYEKSQGLESTLLTIQAIEATKGSIITDPEGKIVNDEEGNPRIREENPNAKLLDVYIDDVIYGLKEDVSSIGNVYLASGVEKLSGSQDEETKKNRVVNVKKAIKSADAYVQYMGVGLKPLLGLANTVGTSIHLYVNSGVFYSFPQFRNSLGRVVSGRMSPIERALMMYSIPNEKELMTEEQRKIAKEKGDMSWVNTWSFSDVMMLTSSFPEKRLELANSLTFAENSMIVEGKIVPIRQYLIDQDRKTKYKEGVTDVERKALERSLNDRVEELKKTSSLVKTCKFENGKLTFPGVSEREVAKFSLLVTEYYLGMNGQMNSADRADYKRDTMINSFFMFKHWIPPLISQRASDINKNVITNEWEYGRTRAFVKTLTHLGKGNIRRINDIVAGNKEGLAILDEMLEQKRIEYFRKTGKTLQITEEEFYDVMRTAIANEFKELKALLCLLGLVAAIAMSEPPEDASDYEKNRYKWLYKGSHKMLDEISFYYNPLSFESMTQGNIFPAMSIGAKVMRFFKALGKESAGYIIDDQEMIDKSYPLKYFINLIPGLYQLDTEVMPYISPEWTKEEGRKITIQTRIQ